MFKTAPYYYKIRGLTFNLKWHSPNVIIVRYEVTKTLLF